MVSIETLKPYTLEHTLDSPYRDVAEAIDAQVTPQEIERLIKKAHEDGLIFHGIKKSRAIEDIEEQGVRPITPEGGYVSFWTTGDGLFTSNDDPSKILSRFMDTPFFFHSSSIDSEGKRRKIIAISSFSNINGEGASSSENRTVLKIKEPVFRDKIEIIDIRGESMSEVQLEMFNRLRGSVLNGPSYGTTTLLKLD
jgi:hypothetical protein